jgi:putative SOS response-associated peptidase YedK
MCGRFVEFSDLEQLRRYFPIDKVLCEITANYNVAPTQEIPVVLRREDSNFLDKFHWGLVPHWAKQISIGYKMINARAETVALKKSFRNAFQKRRCLIPADGFYEWKGPKGDKQPFFIDLPDGQPFAFAGLWEIWGDEVSKQVNSVRVNDPSNIS